MPGFSPLDLINSSALRLPFLRHMLLVSANLSITWLMALILQMLRRNCLHVSAPRQFFSS